MLETVGHPIAVNPDRTLRKIAAERDWEIRTFRNPVPLIPMSTGKELSIGGGVIAGIAAVSAGIWWWYRRPHRAA